MPITDSHCIKQLEVTLLSIYAIFTKLSLLLRMALIVLPWQQILPQVQQRSPARSQNLSSIHPEH